MNQWFYLVCGLALFSLLSFKKRASVIARRPKADEAILNSRLLRPLRGLAMTVWLDALKLLLAFTAVLGMDWLLNTFLWQPAGRNEFRMVALLLLTFLMGEANEQIFVPLAGFSIWMMVHENTFSFPIWLAAGLAFPLATFLFRRLLESCLKHLRLADIPSVFQGWPMVFWLASLVALTLHGWGSVVRLFVN